MDGFQEKIKRVKPLIRYRETRLNAETSVLATIRVEKQNVLTLLKESQRLYLSGLKTLNDERQSGSTSRLPLLESSLDVVKNRWFRALTDLRKVEEREKIQIVQVMVAQRDFKSLEKLEERYHEQMQKHEQNLEQKNNDEIAIRSFSQDDG